MSSIAPDAAQIARTGKAITAGIWVCAAITMTASVVNGTSVFAMLVIGALGVVVGLLTSLAVDACLVMVLCGDRQMQALGMTAAWGRALRLVTLLMSLALNCGAALLSGHYFLAALHAIPPLLIVGMSEYGQEVMLTFTAELQRRERERQAVEDRQRRERQAVVDAEDAKRTRIAEEEEARRRREAHQRALTAEAERTAVANKRAAEEAERLHSATTERARVAREVLERPRLVVNNTPRKANAAAPVGQRAQEWLMSQHRAGVDYAEIGPAEIARAIDAKYETCKSSHKTWKAKVADELRLFAELEEAVG